MTEHPHTILTITRSPDGEIEVWQDGKTTRGLCLGEMIEQVLALVTCGQPLRRQYLMDTPEGWANRRVRLSITPDQEKKI